MKSLTWIHLIIILTFIIAINLLNSISVYSQNLTFQAKNTYYLKMIELDSVYITDINNDITYKIYGRDQINLNDLSSYNHTKISDFTISHPFPNPLSEISRISIKNGIAQSMNITISDLSGRILSQSTFIYNGKGAEVILDLSSQTAGIYILNLFSDDFKTTRKIIKTEFHTKNSNHDIITIIESIENSLISDRIHSGSTYIFTGFSGKYLKCEVGPLDVEDDKIILFNFNEPDPTIFGNIYEYFSEIMLEFKFPDCTYTKEVATMTEYGELQTYIYNYYDDFEGDGSVIENTYFNNSGVDINFVGDTYGTQILMLRNIPVFFDNDGNLDIELKGEEIGKFVNHASFLKEVRYDPEYEIDELIDLSLKNAFLRIKSYSY